MQYQGISIHGTVKYFADMYATSSVIKLQHIK